MLRLIPLLALSVTLVAASAAQAQDRQSSGPAVSLQINFGTAPHWSNVRGTRVREVRQNERSNYDVFRYGRYFFAYNNKNDRWYMSRRYNGRYTLVENRSVPRELRRIPRDHWRNYPSSWEDRRSQGGYDRGSQDGYDGGYQGSNSSSTTFQVTFGSAPRWGGISGSRVEMVYGDRRPSYDVFRFGGSYYVYNDNQWYSSSRESGQFTRMDERSIPTELTQVPRENWRNYPPAWGTNGGNPSSNGNGNGRGNRGNNDQGGRGNH